MSVEKLVVVVSTVGLFSIYVVFLYSKALLDSDVVKYYLPIAREIVEENGFTYSTGYDYNVYLKPIGVSVLYAWTYITANSIYSEAFRLIPLVPLFILIVLNYEISILATKSRTIAAISTAIFLVLPFHDRFILYSSFYPDVLYYPLIFGLIYLMMKYSQTRKNSLLFWIGVTLGVASLLKAQTAFLLPATLMLLFFIEVKNQKLLLILCLMLPFYIFAPNILLMGISPEGILFHFPSINNIQLVLFVFLLAPSSVCFLIVKRIRIEHNKVNGTKTSLLAFMKKIFLLLLPLVSLAGMWYVVNIIRVGTLIDIEPLNLPNWTRAKEILTSIGPQHSTVNMISYVVHFMFMPLDPAVMGFVWLIPLLTGLIYSSLKPKAKPFMILLLFEILLAITIISHNIYNLSQYNPRDIFVFAPLFTTLSSIGIVSIFSSRNNVKQECRVIHYILVAWFGLTSYIHSVLMWWFPNTTVGFLAKSLASISNLTLAQTSFQITERIAFVWENIDRIVLVSLVGGLPFILLAAHQIFRRILSKFDHKLSIKTWKQLKTSLSTRLTPTYTATFFASLILLVILIPRIEVFNVGGGMYEYRENQLKKSYGEFYDIIRGDNKPETGILTYKVPRAGFPYYLPRIKIVDLYSTTNLAFFLSQLNSSRETVVKMKDLGISNLLINPFTVAEIDKHLNFTISSIIGDPELAILKQEFGNWKLYSMGPYSVEKTIISLSNSTIDYRYTFGSYNFVNNESGVFLELYPLEDEQGRITIVNGEVPILNLSSYDLLIVKLKGSSNARILIRFFLNEGGFDVAYWLDPHTCNILQFNLKPYYEKTLREIYISLRSSNDEPAYVNIKEIVFYKIKS